MKKVLMSLVSALAITSAFLLSSAAPAGSETKVIFLTKTGAGNWTVPEDWNPLDNSIEVIGGGGAGGYNNSRSSSGGGGGAYSKNNNVLLTPGDSISYYVGNGTDIHFHGSLGEDTWFTSDTYIMAKGGHCGYSYANGVGDSLGGDASAGYGEIRYSGGNGVGNSSTYADDGCAGGAAGPNGNGNNGISANSGGQGDVTYGGAGGTISSRNGNNGTEWDSTHGSGGGGYGTAQNVASNGGLYGGGGGGRYYYYSGVGKGGNGIIVITYEAILAPTITTQVATNLAKTTATGNGNITDDGGASIVEHGVCWSTFSNPTTTDSYTTIAGGTLDVSFTSNMTGLVAGTQYHYRAFATNSVLTGYGADTTFTTTAPNTPSIDNYNTGSYTNDNTPILQFDLSDPDGDTIYYHLQIADNGEFSNPLVNAYDDPGSVSPRDDVQHHTDYLSDGAYYWRVKCIYDLNAQSGWAVANNGAVAFIVDTVEPAAPVITNFNYNTSGQIESITGTAEANATVKVYDGGTYFGDAVVDVSGHWCLDLTTSPLDSGSHLIYAVTEDAASNPSDDSYNYSLNQSIAVNVYQDNTIYKTESVSMRMEREASYEFKFAVNADLPVTVHAYLQKNAEYGAYPNPSITLSGLGIEGTGPAAASGAGEGSWLELTVAGTPDADGVLDLRVETFSTAAGARAWIDDISITQ